MWLFLYRLLAKFGWATPKMQMKIHQSAPSKKEATVEDTFFQLTQHTIDVYKLSTDLGISPVQVLGQVYATPKLVDAEHAELAIHIVQSQNWRYSARIKQYVDYCFQFALPLLDTAEKIALFRKALDRKLEHDQTQTLDAKFRDLCLKECSEATGLLELQKLFKILPDEEQSLQEMVLGKLALLPEYQMQ